MKGFKISFRLLLLLFSVWCSGDWREEFIRPNVANLVLITEYCDFCFGGVGRLIKTSQYCSLYFPFLNSPKNCLELPLPDTTGQKTVLDLGKVTKVPMETIMETSENPNLRNDPPLIWKTNNKEKSSNGKSGLEDGHKVTNYGWNLEVRRWATRKYPPHINNEWNPLVSGKYFGCLSFSDVVWDLATSQAFQRKFTKAEWKYRAQALYFSMSHFT